MYATKKRGMWEILLLYDKESNMLLSFMRENRLKNIRKANQKLQPQYIHALLMLNQRLQAKAKQQTLFDMEKLDRDDRQLLTMLNSLCENFNEPIMGSIGHHALVVFATNSGQLCSLKAYVLDSDLDIVSEQDWLDQSKPIMSIAIDSVSKDDEKRIQRPLTKKATERLKQKELVAAKALEESSIKLS